MVQTPQGPVEVALHVSSVSSHARATYEKRFQNPATSPPVSDFGGACLPVLLGLDDPQHPTVFVAIDGQSRLGRRTRFSILFHERILNEARANGWAVYESNTGEKIYAFAPGLFPAFIEQILAGEMLPPEVIVEAAQASGVLEAPENEDATALAAQRASKAVNILVRKAGAGRKIREAYGHKCAMCGMGSNLVEGAHIYPVEAAGSTDEVWNGLSLCLNHHGAFDRHLIWIDPITKAIKLHPSLHDEAHHNPGTQHFVQSTVATLKSPTRAADSPRHEMFQKRYAYYIGKYDWVR